jgi:hypothetical protein
MALNNITFNTVAGGLGRLPAGKDHVSAIVMTLIAKPDAWGTAVGKRYVSAEEAELDEITADSANYGLLHYFIKEFFRMSGPSELYVCQETGLTVNNFIDLTKGDVRQIFWYSSVAFAGIAARVGILKTFATGLDTEFCPAVILTNIKDETTAVTGSVVDLRPLEADTISVIIGGDGSGTGAALADDLNVKYVPAGGTILGVLSRAAVHENAGWVGKFPLADKTDFIEAVLSDGQKVRAVATSVLTAINDKGYIFCRNIQGVPGTFVNDTHTCAPIESDFKYIEAQRTIQKAKREIRTSLLPDLNSPLTVLADGTLSPDTTKYFENKAARPLALMQNAGEISEFSVFVDPDQDVLTDSVLKIQVKIIPRGVARYIVVNIGYAVQIG